jgi:F0F1-type ATP synthase membrane subunit b/b'
MSSTRSPRVQPDSGRFASAARAAVVVTLAVVALALPPHVSAQVSKIVEKGREWWSKMVATAETEAKATHEKLKKLEADAAKATGAAKEKLAAEAEKLRAQLAKTREKLHESLEAHAKATREELKELEEQTVKAGAQAKQKLAPKMEQLKEEWNTSLNKLHASLQTHMESARAELKKLEADAAKATAKAKETLGPKIDKLKADLSATRKKLQESLKARMEATGAELKKLEADAAKATGAAKAKIQKQIDTLKASHDEDVKKLESSEPDKD